MDVAHSATAKAATSEPYTCGKCGYSGTGHAVAIAGATVRQGGLVFGNDRAGEMARDEAEARAWQEVLTDVALAPCPRCGAIDRAAWASWAAKPAFLVRALIGILALAAGVMLFAGVFTAGNAGGMICAGVLGLVVLTGGPALALLPIARKRASTRRVRFEPPGRP